ncbi:MAG: hypothetical protein HY516_02555 [Candidatus Aenigmarchaeota archaeon]|nr:hypothetical protein [Candidatus Aenigmarchaeota archaeon]
MSQAEREEEIRAEITGHGYPYVIAGSLYDELFANRSERSRPLETEVAAVLNYDLTGSLSDLPILEHIALVRKHLSQITRQSLAEIFQAELEKELANAVRQNPFYAQITNNANYVVREAVKRAMQESRVNRVNGRGEISTAITQLETGLNVDAKVDVYVGKVKYTPAPVTIPGGMDTAKRAATAMQSVREVPVYGNFILKRVGRPEITPVSAPVDLGEKEPIHPSHRVSMSYTGKLAYADMMGLYETGRIRLRNRDKN